MTQLTLQAGCGKELSLASPALMGIVNVTPDSFSDGGRLGDLSLAIQHAEQLLSDGADILDIGGESTRPGAPAVDEDTEISRVLPLIEALVRNGVDCPISIDTQKHRVAQAACDAGATMINDVSALGDPMMGKVAANTGALLVLMHMRGVPATMQSEPIHYDDVTDTVTSYLTSRVALAVAAGVPKDRIVTDPGIGFGKELVHNLSLIKHLDKLHGIGCPILFGPSRKRFLGEVTGREVGDRDRATAAACTAAVLAGAAILRVHDVAAVKDAVLVAHAIRSAN